MTPFGRYRLVRRVGSGGMAEIWKARVDGPSGFEKTVAIKRILPNFEEDSEFVSMFISEARLAARLVHPNIVQVHDFGLEEDEGLQKVHYIAMEYVAGQNVSTLLKRLSEKGARVPIEIGLYICSESAKALSYAHTEVDNRGNPLGFVHRDISPHNLMVTYRGDVKVADFGIAKAVTAIRQTAAGVFKGKITYMSPEQARTEPLDARSDLFSLGIVLFELATGRRLFFGTIEEVFAQMRAFSPPDATRLAGVPQDVQEIIRRALAVNRDDRYDDAAEMEADLNRALAAGGWVTSRTDLASLMQAQFAREIELEKRDSAPPDRPKTAVLTNPDLDLEGVKSDSGTVTPRQHGSTVEGLATYDTEPTPPRPEPMAATVNRPVQGPGSNQTQSALSLKRDDMRVVERGRPETAPRGSSRLAIGLAIGALLPIAGWIIVTMFPSSVETVAAPTPAPTATAIAEVSAVPSSTPQATEAPDPTPAKVAARVTPVRTAARPAPTPTAAVRTVARIGTPTPVPVRATGIVNFTARPWVQVWVDGKKIAEETPVKRHVLSAGKHDFRFVNARAGFDKSFRYDVAADREVEIAVDTKSGKIDVRR